MRWRWVPRPTKDAPVRIGFAQVVPRHMIAPPQWIGGWVGCIWARTAEWMPSAPVSSAPFACEIVPSARSTVAVTLPSVFFAITSHTAAELHGIGTDPLQNLLMEQHVQMAAMNRILRPVVSGEQPARFGIDVVAVEPNQRPFLGGEADPVEVMRGDAEIVEFAHGVGLQVDADAERAHFADRFEYDARHTDLMQREGCRQSADAATGDDNAAVAHALCSPDLGLLTVWGPAGASSP